MLPEYLKADFDPSDFTTQPVWAKVVAYCRLRIDSLREQNDGDLDPEATAKLRGRIEAFKEIVGLQSAPDLLQDGEQD